MDAIYCPTSVPRHRTLDNTNCFIHIGRAIYSGSCGRARGYTFVSVSAGGRAGGVTCLHVTLGYFAPSRFSVLGVRGVRVSFLSRACFSSRVGICGGPASCNFCVRKGRGSGAIFGYVFKIGWL